MSTINHRAPRHLLGRNLGKTYTLPTILPPSASQYKYIHTQYTYSGIAMGGGLHPGDTRQRGDTKARARGEREEISAGSAG